MITTRGKRVRAVVIVAGLALLWWISANLWWVGTQSPKADFLGYCVGSMTECVNL